MSCLYIGGAQCKHADFHDSEDCSIFDNQKSEMTKLAQEFNVYISRYCLDENDYSYVIMNKKANHECFYPGASFYYNMAIEQSGDFEARANDFINALNKTQEFSQFHDLKWSETECLYFVVS